MPSRIPQVEFPFGNPVNIAAAFTAPIIVGAAIVVRSVLPLPEDLTYRAADTILADPAFNRPRLPKESAGLTAARARIALRDSREAAGESGMGGLSGCPPTGAKRTGAQC
jgi:hypothetical protein